MPRIACGIRRSGPMLRIAIRVLSGVWRRSGTRVRLLSCLCSVSGQKFQGRRYSSIEGSWTSSASGASRCASIEGEELGSEPIPERKKGGRPLGSGPPLSFLAYGSPGHAPMIPAAAHSIVVSSSTDMREPAGTRRIPFRSKIGPENGSKIMDGSVICPIRAITKS